VPSDSPEPPATDEAARNKKIRDLQVLHTEAEPVFDNLVQMAATACGASMAAFGVLDRENYWHKARHHWPLDDLPHAETPCANVALSGQSLVETDAATAKELTQFTSLQSHSVAAYAGAPVIVDGIGIGCLAVAHENATDFSDAHLQTLKLLAEQISLQLSQRIRLAELETENSELLIQELGAELAEEKYRSIFEHVQEGIFQTTAEGRFISANPMLATIYGYETPEELTASMNDISDELYVDPQRRAEFVQRMQESDTIQNFQSQVRRHDGSLIWISENVRAVRNNDGKLLYYEGTVVDITEQKEIELALRDSELLYHSLVESIPQNIVRKDLNGQFTFANQKFCNTMELSLEEIIGKTDHDLSPKALADKYLRDDQYIIETGKSFATTEEHSSPDGGKTIIDVVKTPLLGSDGNITGIQVMFWDVTERHQMEEELAYERDLLNALLENVPDRIYIKDTESRFIKGSAALAKRLGLENTEAIVGKTDYDFHPSTQAQQFHEDEQRVVLTGKAVINKVEQQSDQAGKSIWASVTKVPFHNRSGMITGIIGISRDITALKLAEEESARARDMALEAAQMKAQFLAVMSHEIRTPMNGIIGMIDLLLASELSDEQLEYADTVRTSADALLEILNDILDLTKIESGRLELEKEEFSLRQVLEEAVELHALRAESNHIELNCHIPLDLNGRFNGDAGRLRQVLLNLVSNAVKFTEQGEVQASAEKIGDTPDGVVIQFSVRDTGIGIPSEVQEKIFDAFRQADGSTNRRYGGTGLGLSISRQLTEIMGGKMWLESEPGQGSTFHFTVELGAGETKNPELPGEFANRRLMVAMPNDFARSSISTYAEYLGMQPTQAPSGESACEALAKDEPFDLILLDLTLHDVDCLDLVREIQAHPVHQNAKIILITMRRHTVDPGMFRTLGIAGTLIKPVRLVRLQQSLLLALTGKTHAPKVKPTDSPGQHRSLRILVAEDNPINQRVAALQLTKLGHTHTLKDDGQAVLDSDLTEFDIILMDCQMPMVDGLEATRQIRQREMSQSGDPIYIIAMTANTQEDDRAACLEAGMDDFISKPVQIAELESSLAKSLGMEAPAAEAQSALPLLDDSQLDQLRGNGAEDALREIIEMYLADTAEQLANLQTASNESDIEAIQRIAHQLKGSSANLGARRLADALARLEDAANSGELSNADNLLGEICGTFDRTQIQFRAQLEPS